MTLDEAVAELRCAGLEVSVGSGVAAVYAFGFSAHRHGSSWFFRHRGTGRGPAEQLERLEDVVERVTARFANQEFTRVVLFYR